VTRLTLALMYATDFSIRWSIASCRPCVPDVVLADRFIFTLIARGVVRGINRDYMGGLYAMALRPHLTFWLNVRPETAFGASSRKRKRSVIGRRGGHVAFARSDWSFIRYQTMIKREFEVMAKRHGLSSWTARPAFPP